MPKFEFSLDAVLQQREWRERECQRQLAVLLGRMSELEGQLRSLDDAVAASNGDLRDGHLTGRIDLAFLAAHRRFVLASQRRAREVMQRMALLTRQIDEARGLLVEASRARKVVEKLRERRLAEWKAKLLASEQQESDDISSKMTTQVWQEEQRMQALLQGG
jgi:flagellar FliJ protein